MTVSPKIQAQQARAATFGRQLLSAAVAIPTGSTTLWTVSGGPVLITNVELIVVTAMSGTVTTVNIGTVAGATTLMNAQAVTSALAGATFGGIPVLSSPGVGSVQANVGAITWIASAGNTGTAQVGLSFIPLVPGATVG